MRVLTRMKALYRNILEGLEELYILIRISRLHGHECKGAVRLEAGFVVFSLVKDAQEHIAEFIRYYTVLGAKSIMIVDNGSVDATVDIAESFENVTVFSTSLDFARFESTIRRSFLRRYCRNMWVLAVDVDEHFDFPRGASTTMGDFITYLNSNRYTAVTACMLDMFALEPADRAVPSSFLSRYPYLDYESIEKEPYPNGWLTRNNVVPTGVCIYKGGIRKEVLRTQHEFLLVKHPLMYIDDQIIPFTHPHYCANARIADVVCVLLHFKFTDGLAAKATRIADDSNSDPTWATEHRLYKEFFSANASLLGSHRAYKYGSVMDLANKGFLYVSPTYRAFI